MTPVVSRVALALTYRHWTDSLPPACNRSSNPGYFRIVSVPPPPDAQYLPRRQRHLYGLAHMRTRRLMEELPDQWTVTLEGIQRRRLLALTEKIVSQASYRLVERTSGRTPVDGGKQAVSIGFVRGPFVRVAGGRGQSAFNMAPPPLAQPPSMKTLPTA